MFSKFYVCFFLNIVIYHKQRSFVTIYVVHTWLAIMFIRCLCCTLIIDGMGFSAAFMSHRYETVCPYLSFQVIYTFLTPFISKFRNCAKKMLTKVRFHSPLDQLKLLLELQVLSDDSSGFSVGVGGGIVFLAVFQLFPPYSFHSKIQRQKEAHFIEK